MENCTTCKNAVFDALWGEYRCMKRQTGIYILLDSTECADYAKGEFKESMANAEYYAKFED